MTEKLLTWTLNLIQQSILYVAKEKILDQIIFCLELLTSVKYSFSHYVAQIEL